MRAGRMVPIRIADLRCAQINAQGIDVAQIVADESAGSASDVEKLLGMGEIGSDRPELQVVPAIAYASLAIENLIVEARGNLFFIVEARTVHHLFPESILLCEHHRLPGFRTQLRIV